MDTICTSTMIFGLKVKAVNLSFTGEQFCRFVNEYINKFLPSILNREMNSGNISGWMLEMEKK